MLIKKIKYKVIKFLYEYFKKIYIRNINISDNEILQYAHNELTIAGHNKPTINIDCVEIEIAPDNWIMAVDTNNLDLTYLSLSYDIQWKNCFCMKDIRLEDVIPELEKRAFEEIENNK